MSSTRHAVMRGPSLTGLGKVPAFTLRQSVADENGKIAGISWDSACSRWPAMRHTFRDLLPCRVTS